MLLQSIVPSVMALSLKASFYATATTLATPLKWFKPTEGKNIGFSKASKTKFTVRLSEMTMESNSIICFSDF